MQEPKPPPDPLAEATRKVGYWAGKAERLSEVLESTRSQCEHFLQEKERLIGVVDRQERLIERYSKALVAIANIGVDLMAARDKDGRETLQVLTSLSDSALKEG